MKQYDIGIVGLAVMGRSLALNMADHGFAVAGYNRSRAVTDAMVEQTPHQNFTPYYDLAEMIAALKKPRRVFLMVKAGAAVDALIEQLLPLLEQGDIVMDGGNSFFEDTSRRAKYLSERGLCYLGVGVSGGEHGARFGPAIMPGGEKAAYAAVQPILQGIAAKAQGAPCCTYIGPEGAGHYVKMVHNGIEYADMQLIAESYLLLRYVGGFSNAALADLFAEWNKGELKSFLIEITARILREQDDLGEGDLLDKILDSAGQKGTGRWTSIEALRQGVEISMINASCGARILSNRVEGRRAALSRMTAPAVQQVQDKAAFAEGVRQALYAGKIIAYAQGFSMMRDASKQYGWQLDLGKIASIFRGGCIIQAAFLNDITEAFASGTAEESLLLSDFFLAKINACQGSLRGAAAAAVANGLPTPALLGATAYLDAFRGAPNGANLIQAQRDLFGAHTYERNDRQGSYHHEWGQANAD